MMQISQAAVVQHLDDVLSLIGPEMARKSTTNCYAHPPPGPEEIEIKNYFLQVISVITSVPGP